MPGASADVSADISGDILLMFFTLRGGRQTFFTKGRGDNHFMLKTLKVMTMSMGKRM